MRREFGDIGYESKMQGGCAIRGLKSIITYKVRLEVARERSGVEWGIEIYT